MQCGEIGWSLGSRQPLRQGGELQTCGSCQELGRLGSWGACHWEGKLEAGSSGRRRPSRRGICRLPGRAGPVLARGAAAACKLLPAWCPAS